MVPADTAERSLHYLSTFRTYVLEPVETALERVEGERREIIEECEAFEAFARRVSGVPTVSATGASPGAPLLMERRTESDQLLLEAYEETITDVDHYERVYGESIEEHLLAEFGPEFAVLFDSSSNAPFTTYQKEALTTATHARIEERERFDAALEREETSLRSARRTIESTLDGLDSTVVPGWYRERFDARVNDLLEARQSIIGRRPPFARLDGHDLCEYLYVDEPWTYPVLTAVGRLLDSIVVRS